jgi:2-iminobutanoate/2-iminopropanoate deaminase
MTRKAIHTKGAAVVGPYSHAVRAGKLLYLSGQTPLDPATHKMLEGDVQIQTAQCFQNLFAVLREAGMTPDHVVKVNVFLTDINDFDAMNEIYAAHFAQPFPARTTIGVAALPLGARIEIELIARKD